MGLLSDSIDEVYESPSLMKESYEINEISFVDHVLKPKRIIYLSPDKMKTFLSNKDVWLNKDDRDKYFKDLEANDISTSYDFSAITDTTELSGYIGYYEKYFCNLHYLYWAFANNKDIEINVYDEYKYDPILNNRNWIISEIIGATNKWLNKKDFDFNSIINLPMNAKYSKFTEVKYDENIYISKSADPVTLLSVNLPYLIYSVQPLSPSIYNYNETDDLFTFGTMSTNEFSALVRDVVVNGFDKPLVMTMNGEHLLTPDIDSEIKLFIAKLLKIPYIPVIIYFSNDENIKNKFMNDILETKNSSITLYSNNTILSLNSIFKSNVIVNINDNNGNEYLDSCGIEYNTDAYPVVSKNKYVTIRKHDLDKESKLVKTTVDPFEEIVKANLKEAEDNMNQEIEEQIKKLSLEE